MLSDLLLAIDSGDLATFVLLDLSAVFDTVDHAILLGRLGFRGPVRSQLVSFLHLTGRSQYVRRVASRSPSERF